MAIDTVIFDMGGVLARWCPMTLSSLVRQEHPNVPENIFEVVHTSPWQDFDRGFLSEEETIQACGVEFGVEHVRAYLHRGRQLIMESIPRGVEILDKVKRRGHKTYLLSNMPHSFIPELFEKHPCLQWLDGHLFSGEHGVCKPEPKIYEKMIELFQLDPKRSVFIDDMERNLKAAEAFGIRGILCQKHDFVEDELKRLQVL